MSTVTLPSFGLVLEVDVATGAGRIVSSDLTEPGSSDAFDAIERLVLAHACAGVDVSSPSYLEGLETVVGAIGNEA